MTNAGFAAIAGLVGNTGSINAATYLAYGDGTTAAAAADTALKGTESQRAAATVSRVTTTVTNDTLQLAKTFSISSTETIAEAGVLNATAAGTLFSRAVLSAARSVTSGDSYVCTYKIKFS
jgi:hypothetical protein